jgi:SAM-dependent methyltransferase
MTIPRTDRAYRDFWAHVAETFPSLKGAASTRYYFQCERALCEELFPALGARSLLKTDLWDEAKNTEVLRWAASRGARPIGIDIAFPIVAQAARLAWDGRPGLAVADLRAIPLRSDSVDLVYSMGTIEHFADYRTAAAEIRRVLKTGGVAIVGVPNKLDPFMRPALVWALNRLGWYAYGREKSFTPAELRRLLEDVGFRVTASSGILFMPGWLRMLDLLLHTRYPRWAGLTAPAVALFAWAYRRFPAVRRHGYLIAVRAVKDRGRAGRGD